MRSNEIASICHEANRQITRLIGDVPVQPPWEECGADMRASAVKGVEWRLNNQSAPASAQHDAWMQERIAQGWTLGPVKDVVKKEHPALIPYERLAPGVRSKDAVFTAIVLALKDTPVAEDGVMP